MPFVRHVSALTRSPPSAPSNVTPLCIGTPISRSRAMKYAPFAATAGRASNCGAARSFADVGAVSSTAATWPPWLAYCHATRYSSGPVPAKTTRGPIRQP